MSDDLEDRIKRRAHQIWEEEGRPDGRHDEHWMRALEEFADEPVVLPGGATSAPPEQSQRQTQFAREDYE